MRAHFDEADVEALTADPRFVVAADAYRSGCCTMAQMLQLAFTAPPYIPRDLEPQVFANLVFQVIDQIQTGIVMVPEHLKIKFRCFYDQQEMPDD